MTPTQKRALPKIGQGARIIVAGESYPLQITARVESISEAGEIGLKPVAGEAVSSLAAGQAITLEYFHHDAAHRLSTHIWRLLGPSDATPVLLAPPDEIKKIQRRRFPRLSVLLSAQLMPVVLPVEFEKDEKTRRRQLKQWAKQLDPERMMGVTEAISASGIRLASDVTLHEGGAAFVSVALDDHPLLTAGMVTWVGPARSVPYTIAYGIEFLGLEPSERAIIETFVGSRAKK